MVSLEFSGKTVKAAIEEGLKSTGKSLDEVEINIVTSGGFLKKAKVMLSFEGAANQAKNTADVAQKVMTDLNLTRKPPREKSEKHDYTDYEPPVQEPAQTEPRRNERPRHDRRNDRRDNRQSNGNNGNNGERNTQKSAQNKQKRRDDRPRRNEDEGERERRERPNTPVTDEIAATAEEFLKGMLTRMGVEFGLEKTITDGRLKFALTCESGLVIGYRGETLDAIEYITSLAVNKSDDKYYKICLDCNGYKQKREEMLGNLARRMAQKAIKTRRKVIMEPMSSSSRKIIHSILSEDNSVITRSEGHDPNRYVVIIPKRPQNAPAE